MYESDDIIDYLYDKYGPGKDKVSSLLRAGALTILTAGFGLAPRMGAGSRYKPAKMPEKPITVYSYEASPFCKLVREKLVELEILSPAQGERPRKSQEAGADGQEGEVSGAIHRGSQHWRGDVRVRGDREVSGGDVRGLKTKST